MACHDFRCPSPRSARPPFHLHRWADHEPVEPQQQHKRKEQKKKDKKKPAADTASPRQQRLRAAMQVYKGPGLDNQAKAKLLQQCDSVGEDDFAALLWFFTKGAADAG